MRCGWLTAAGATCQQSQLVNTTVCEGRGNGRVVMAASYVQGSPSLLFVIPVLFWSQMPVQLEVGNRRAAYAPTC
jgi:hypothetical protein